MSSKLDRVCRFYIALKTASTWFTLGNIVPTQLTRASLSTNGKEPLRLFVYLLVQTDPSCLLFFSTLDSLWWNKCPAVPGKPPKGPPHRYFLSNGVGYWDFGSALSPISPANQTVEIRTYQPLFSDCPHVLQYGCCHFQNSWLQLALTTQPRNLGCPCSTHYCWPRFQVCSAPRPYHGR